MMARRSKPHWPWLKTIFLALRGAGKLLQVDQTLCRRFRFGGPPLITRSICPSKPSIYFRKLSALSGSVTCCKMRRDRARFSRMSSVVSFVISILSRLCRPLAPTRTPSGPAGERSLSAAEIIRSRVIQKEVDSPIGKLNAKTVDLAEAQRGTKDEIEVRLLCVCVLIRGARF